ncbi:hypothetical protein TRFO_26888 [Tritrichomonas foetus]|uniref:E3 ubiquitin-protein ligase n=1 Tax=Tritrichomonas foetus TaxID=1144522 RepID=A0A1J4K7L1_9EUKA|nr:hypothetical protein TRFO_26888 [Tritrichomonas foetus]|eukprot:OHT05405.1 hypothetical protein TRFO_26888 [Tritrichomonas foetus]
MDPGFESILNNLFQTNPAEAVEMSGKLIVNDPDLSFSDWLTLENQRITEFSCQETWDTPHIVVVCQTCAIGKNSGICVPCFLNGNHEGHDVIIEISDSGACDCGNSSCWDPKGFCKHHTSLSEDPHIIDLGEERSNFISSIVTCAASAIIPLSIKEGDDVSYICEFLLDLMSIGDAYQRIVVLAMSRYDLTSLLFNWPRFTLDNASIIYKFVVELANDGDFIQKFIPYFCDLFTYLVGLECNTTTSKNYIESSSISFLIEISFFTWNYVASHPSMISENNLPELIARTLTIFTSLFAYDLLHPIVSNSVFRALFENISIIINTEYFLTMLENPEKQYILSTFLENICLIEANPVIEISDQKNSKILQNSCLAHRVIYETFSSLTRVNVNSSVFFSSLSLFVLMNVLRDIVDKPTEFSPAIWQRSIFQRGVCLGCFLPLHFLAFEHFITHSDDPKKDWETIAEQQHMETEILLFGATVLPIRTCALLSYMSFEMSPAPEIISVDYDPIISVRGRWGAAYCAVALASETDDVVSMIMHTFGLFDNDKQMNNNRPIRFFAFLHFIAVLVTDTSIFCRSKYELLRRKVIAILQESPKTLSQIIERIGDIENQFDLKMILDEVAIKTKNMGKNGSNDGINSMNSFGYINSSMNGVMNNDLINSGMSSLNNWTNNGMLKGNYGNMNQSRIQLNSTSSSSHTSGTTMFALNPKFGFLMVPLSIWIGPIIAYEVISRYVDPDSSTLFYFLNGKEEVFPEGYDMKKLLFTQCFFAACYMAIVEVDVEIDYTTITLLLNLLLLVDKYNTEPPVKEPIPAIQVQTYEQLCLAMPSSFPRFLKTPFAYRMRNGVTFLELVRTLGPVSNHFINSLFKGNGVDNRKKIDYLKLQTMKEFTHAQNEYLPKPLRSISSHNHCVVCHKPMKTQEQIPALCYAFRMPSGRATYRVAISGNAFHCKCFSNARKSMLHFNFILNDTRSVLGKFDHKVEKLVQTIADEIEILELRHSRNPFIFKDRASILKLSYLFEAAKASIKEKKKDKFRRVETDFLSIFISDLLLSNNAKDDFLTIFKNVYQEQMQQIKEINQINQLNKSKKANSQNNQQNATQSKDHDEFESIIDFCMLRRILFVGFFVVPLINLNTIEELVNDIVLATNYFDIEISSVVDTRKHNIEEMKLTHYENLLQYYKFIDLPHNFLEFTIDPFNIDILHSDSPYSMLCLLTGKCIESNETGKHLAEVQSSLFLVLSGIIAGSLKYMCNNEPTLTKMVESPYITIFGDEQYGLKDGYMLYLNHDRLWRVFDEFLDGSFIAS